MGRYDAAFERDLQSARLGVGRVRRVVARSDCVDGEDDSVGATDDPCIAWPVRQRDMREAREENDQSVVVVDFARAVETEAAEKGG